MTAKSNSVLHAHAQVLESSKVTAKIALFGVINNALTMIVTSHTASCYSEFPLDGKYTHELYSL